MSEPRVVLITGASSGIGYATAVAFARNGDHVVGTGRSLERLEALQQSIGSLPEPHGGLLAVAADVHDADAMQAAVDATMERFGRLDVVIANAGIGHRGSIVDSDWNDVNQIILTNVDGVLHTIRAGVPAMRQGSGGHIVFISSIVYNMVVPYAAYYAATKAFVHSISRSLRIELEPDGITVTHMVVGRTATQFDARRLGGMRPGGSIPSMTPDQVAESILRAVNHRKRNVTLRLLDRLLVLANYLLPDVVGRFAMKQYK